MNNLWIKNKFNYAGTSLSITAAFFTNNKQNYSSNSCFSAKNDINNKNIVIYGSNLGYTVNYKKFSNQLRKLIFLPTIYYSIIVGKLLSDGWLEKSSSTSNTRFRFKQSIDRSFYVIHSFLSLSHYCSNIPFLGQSIRKGKISYSIEFSTRSLPCLNELYLLFYNTGHKVLR